VGPCTAPPAGSTVICAGELGPVIPRTFSPAPGWSGDGHRIKAPLEYSRGSEKTWGYGGQRISDGRPVTMCASSRNSAFYQDFLQLAEQTDILYTPLRNVALGGRLIRVCSITEPYGALSVSADGLGAPFE